MRLAGGSVRIVAWRSILFVIKAGFLKRILGWSLNSFGIAFDRVWFWSAEHSVRQAIVHEKNGSLLSCLGVWVGSFARNLSQECWVIV